MATENNEVILKDGYEIENIPCGSTIEIEISKVNGYSFTQWNYVDEKGKTQTINGNPIKIPVNCSYELTPVYKQEKYTIMINDDDETKQYGGSYYKGETLLKYKTGEAIEADYNESITIIPYEREGYHFTGWVCEPMDNVHTDENGNLIISPITMSYVITPQYEINTYELTISIPTSINLNDDTTITVNLTKNGIPTQLQPLSANDRSETVTIDYNTEVELEVVSTTINNTYNFTGWKINNSTINSSNPLNITMTQNYTLQLQYTEMIELTFIKPDYVTNFGISYTIGENGDPEQIVFGDGETQIVEYLPKSTNIKVTATPADSETETDIPCGGWEKDGVFTVQETTTNELEINNLSSNTTIKPIYCYKVELHVRPTYKTGITNNETNYNFNLVNDLELCNELAYVGHNSDNDIYLVQNGDGSVGANDNNKKAYLSAAGSDVDDPAYEYYPSSIFYQPKSNITCKAVGFDGTVDIPYLSIDPLDTSIYVGCDSWWVKDNNENYQLLSLERILTINALDSNKVIYGALLPINKNIGVRFYYKNNDTYEKIEVGSIYENFFKVDSQKGGSLLLWEPVDGVNQYTTHLYETYLIGDMSPVGLILDVEYQHSEVIPQNQVPVIKYRWVGESNYGDGYYPPLDSNQNPQYIQIGGTNDIDDININNNNIINNNRNNTTVWTIDVDDTTKLSKRIKIPVVTAFSQLTGSTQTQNAKATPGQSEYSKIWLEIYLDPIGNLSN